jgi:hypothetical protein
MDAVPRELETQLVHPHWRRDQDAYFDQPGGTNSFSAQVSTSSIHTGRYIFRHLITHHRLGAATH